MKKRYLFFFMLFIHFNVCYAQTNYPGYNDTIFKDRSIRKIPCKILLVDRYYAYYKLAKDTNKRRKMELWRIHDIHYGTPRPKEVVAQTNKRLDIPDKPDTTPQRFFGQFNFSYAFASGNLPLLQNGFHSDITLEYFVVKYVAVVARAGGDLLSAQSDNGYFQENYTIEEFMGGLSVRSGDNSKLSARNPVPGPPWADFTILGGLIRGQNPKLYGYVENATGVIATGNIDAGTGYGLGGYISFQVNIVSGRKRIISLGAGYLNTTLLYSNYTYNLTGAPGTPYVGQSVSYVQPTKFHLVMFQPYIGFGF
ncbi:MAG TPA: hypothetical protein VK808_07050 [Bacteroidia bacterium]|nr:hypothetical protein [Bacteroidia bacterium]